MFSRKEWIKSGRRKGWEDWCFTSSHIRFYHTHIYIKQPALLTSREKTACQRKDLNPQLILTVLGTSPPPARVPLNPDRSNWWRTTMRCTSTAVLLTSFPRAEPFFSTSLAFKSLSHTWWLFPLTPVLILRVPESNSFHTFTVNSPFAINIS